jgi:hypothetical protein
MLLLLAIGARFFDYPARNLVVIVTIHIYSFGYLIVHVFPARELEMYSRVE